MHDIFQHSQPWADRNGFAEWVLSLIWLFLCLTIFQIVALIIACVGYFLIQYVIDYQGLMVMINGLKQGNMAIITSHIDFLFIANSTWQVLILGFGTYVFVRTCSGKNRRRSYLRLQKNRSIWEYIGIAVLIIIVAQPLIWFLGWLNSFVPVPDALENLQQSQMDLITDFLNNSDNVLFALANVALVPALCEEILFRGFVFRSFERGWGVKISIVCTGTLFGLYHIQPGNLLPLASIGILLTFIAWAADSIYPSMVAHFTNNAASVLLVVYYPNSALAQSSPGTMPAIGLVVVSTAATAYLIYKLLENRPKSQNMQEFAYD